MSLLSVLGLDTIGEGQRNANIREGSANYWRALGDTNVANSSAFGIRTDVMNLTAREIMDLHGNTRLLDEQEADRKQQQQWITIGIVAFVLIVIILIFK